MTVDIVEATERTVIDRGVSLWNEQCPSLAIADWLIEQNLLTPFDGIESRCYAAQSDGDLLAYAAVKTPTRPVGSYDATDTAWLDLFAYDDSEAGRGAGRELVGTLADRLADRGKTELQYGCSPQNLLAGVPDAVSDSYGELLQSVGFEFGDTVYDLERDIEGYTVPETHRNTAREWPNLEVTRATGHEDELLAFLDDQFFGRWWYEAENVCRRPGGARDFWLLRYEDQPVGFVRANRHDGTYRGTNVNWGVRFSDTHCGVGPLGIHEEYRGRGWGLYEIAAVLESLAEDGYDHCVIDWTHLDDYYRKLGFETWVAYESAVLDLPR